MATTSESTPEKKFENGKEISEEGLGLSPSKEVGETSAKEINLKKIVEKIVEAGKDLSFTQFKKAAWEAIDVASGRAIIS